MRSRNIKPGFFENENLAELAPLARLLFAGLWCYADKEGRFEWRPKRIKALILPYDDVDIEELLMSLHTMEFVYMYSVGNGTFGLMPKFKKHQNPHPHEAKSQIPPPSEIIEVNQCHDIDTTLQGISAKCNADSLIPDSLIPEKVNEKAPCQPDCPHQKIVTLYNEILSEKLPSVKLNLWNGARKKALTARWKEDQERQNIAWWSKYFEAISDTPFLVGETESGWTADMGWIVKAENMVKILEGKYKNNKSSSDDWESRI
jgi:hypothetical protein